MSAEPASLFNNTVEANFRSCLKMIESVIRDLGVDPDTNRLKSPNGHPAWGLMRGSAAVYIFLIHGTMSNFVQVVSPVVKVPQEKTQELFARILQLNATELVGAAFGVRGKNVVITADRSTGGLDADEIVEMIRRVGTYADKYDDELAAAFGARRHNEG